jgi:hypothetical protein
MGILDKAVKEYVPDAYVLLQKVRKITNDDIEADPRWAFLKGEYEAVEANHPNNDWMHWCLVSLLNSILYQNRIYFVTTRDTFRKFVMKPDQNWNIEYSKKTGRFGFGDTKWTPFLDYCYDNNIMEKVYEKNNTSVYKVTHPELLKFLKPNEEGQYKESVDFVNNPPKNPNKNNTLDQNKDQHELQHELQHVEISNKKLEVSEPNQTTNQTTKQITLKNLLFDNCKSDFPRFEDLAYLAQKAVENCEDFDGGSSDISTFKRYFERLKGKCTPAQKRLIADLADRFQFEAEKTLSLIKMENVELSEPREIERKAIMNSIDKEQKAQNHTLNVLLAASGREKIDKLKARLEKAEDEKERFGIECELRHWESIL